VRTRPRAAYPRENRSPIKITAEPGELAGHDVLEYHGLNR